jgi:hypothetical protein
MAYADMDWQTLLEEEKKVEPVIDEPVIDEPVIDEPAKDEPVKDKPDAEETA